MMKSYNFSLLLIAIMLSVDSFAATPFAPSAQPAGWLARPGLTSINLTSGSETIYQLNYNKDVWSGDILAKNISNNADLSTTTNWTAATLLDTQALDFTNGRKIVTLNGSTNVPFSWTSLSSTQQTSIGTTTTGPQIVNFVRGDRSNEEPAGASYRARQHVLGDILHSTLHYWKHNATTRRLYVGANDGMLHVFNVADGSEVFAYIPSMLIPNLKYLTSKPYVHTFFVDGGISIVNVDFSGTLKTLLVGGLGAGGKGLYALDVTDSSPASEAAAASKIKWEITPSTTGYADLGYTYGTPRISRLKSGTAAVIVGNGYVNGGSGHAVLYVINADTGALINAIDTGSGTIASPSGLSTPTLLDTNGDNKVDFAYAGDIDGKLWKFDLSAYTATLLYTTSPAQAITTAPSVSSHLSGGTMVAFATGRLLTGGDSSDTSVHYAYGIWDGAPAANNALLTQTLSAATFGTSNVRTITANVPDWSTGSVHHYGWKVALPAGERVTGELPFEKNGRFYFLSTNPTVINTPPPNGDNWLYELVLNTGGSPSIPIFDLNNDGAFSSLDLASGCTPSGVITCIPVAKPLGAGIFSQPTFVEGAGFNTTLYTFHPDTVTTSTGSVSEPPDPGVSGGHFDFDNYYYSGNNSTTSTDTPTNTSKTKTICAASVDVEKEVKQISTTYCTTSNGFPSGYSYMSKYKTGGNDSSCPKKINGTDTNKKYQDITCNTYTTVTTTTSVDYLSPFPRLKPQQPQKHVHEYDDIYDVTGVNMLNASDTAFNLSNAITDPNTKFKVLVMNQYLNPAAKISIGGATYESVKTYKNLASATDATTLLSGLPSYTRANIDTLIFNLPLDAFKSKDWWGDGAGTRAGLIPTVYDCVAYVKADGSMKNSNGQGLIGPNGERFDGALTIQIIKDTTPASALELNHANSNKNGDGTNGTSAGMSDSDRARYGWRVIQSEFTKYVLAEYTTYWHHPNGICYGESNWNASAPEDLISDAIPKTPATGSADPKDGIFSAGLAVKSVTSTVSGGGGTKTTVTTYSDNSTYTKVEVINGNGSTTVTQTFRDGTTAVTTLSTTTAGQSGMTLSPEEDISKGATGRQSWWEIFQ